MPTKHLTSFELNTLRSILMQHCEDCYSSEGELVDHIYDKIVSINESAKRLRVVG